MVIVDILVFILILGALVFVHEGGHFIAARLSGVKVEEFGLGIPPRLFAIKRGETEYSINAIPIGGFCKLLGEEDPSAPRSLASKSAGKRLFVLGAGPLMNAVLPLILLTIALMIPRSVIAGDVLVENVAPNSPAAEAGIVQGDIIISINDQSIQNSGDLIYQTYLSLGDSTTLGIEEPDGNIKTVTLVPRLDPPEGEGAMGVQLNMINTYEISESDPFWKAVPKSATELWQTLELYRNVIRKWAAGGGAPEIRGPVGILQFQVEGQVTESGLSYILRFAAVISISLAIMNLLPIPALDGSRMFFVLLEVVRRGKRVSPGTEARIHAVGFALLITLMLVVTYLDIIRWVRD